MIRPALLAVFVLLLVVTVADAQPRRSVAVEPSIRGYEIDNGRCFAAFSGSEAALRMPLGGEVSSGDDINSTLAIEDGTAEGRARLEAWIASGVPRGRQFLVFPLVNERGRRFGWEAVCVALQPIVRPEDVTLGPSRPTDPPSARVLRDMVLSPAALERLAASFAERVVFVDAEGSFRAWWSIEALVEPDADPYLGFDR